LINLSDLLSCTPLAIESVSLTAPRLTGISSLEPTLKTGNDLMVDSKSSGAHCGEYAEPIFQETFLVGNA
jgi:hypothetical protein